MGRIRTKKYFILFLAGLFMIAASSSSAAEKDSGNADIQPLSAEKFLSENVRESGWKDYIGASAKNVKVCGSRMCNLEKKLCMTRKRNGNMLESLYHNAINGGARMAEATVAGGAMGSAFAGVGAVAGAAVGLGVGAVVEVVEYGSTTVSYTEYECIDQNQRESYQKAGWSISNTGGANATIETNKNGSTVDEEDVDQKECYSAKGVTDSSEINQYCLVISGDTVIVMSAKNDKEVCEVIPVALYQHERCAFCFFLGTIYHAADAMTYKSYISLATSFSIVIVVGLAIWIAMKTLAFVSSMTKQDAAKYITEMLKQSYKFMIAFFLLQYYSNVFSYIINPLLAAGIDFGNSFLSEQDFPRASLFEEIQEQSVDHKLSDLKKLGDKLPNDYFINLDCQDKKAGEEGTCNKFYNFDMFAKLEHFTHNVNLKFATLQVIGQSLFCNGKNYMSPWGVGKMQWGLGFASVIYGICFSVMGFLLSLAFVFYMLDAVVQLGIVGALLPLLIIAWPFKISVKWTNTGFKMFLNSVFTFMMMGVLAEIVIQLISTAVAQNSSIGGGLQELAQALDTKDDEKLKSMVNVLSMGFLMFVFINMISFLMLGKVSSLVDRFAAGGMKAIAPSIATMGASAVKGAAQKLTAPTMEAIGEKTNKAVKGIIQHPVSTTKGIARGVKSGANRLANLFSKNKNTGGGSGPTVGRRPSGGGL